MYLPVSGNKSAKCYGNKKIPNKNNNIIIRTTNIF